MHIRHGFETLRKIIHMSPDEMWIKAKGRLRGVVVKFIVSLIGSEISDKSFQKSFRSDIRDKEEFLTRFREQKSRQFFIRPDDKEKTTKLLLQLCPHSKDVIVRAADRTCEHSFDLLGSGPTLLGSSIDWHVDFKSGYRWNAKQFYTEIRPAPYPGGYDLKVPWELSRCQHFTWLGQAYWLTGDEKYAREYRAQIEEWIVQNPPEFGVNWACSMDIAIRAVNWLWGYAFFQFSPELDDHFCLTFCKSLLSHGRHIMSNLERTSNFAGNHYLSDIVGLVYLGFLVPELEDASTWREFGLMELESEMFKQVYSDGGNFEASTNYHRLVTELFLSATLLARLNGHLFNQEYLSRLERMIDFIYQTSRPDGTVPVIGDQDNGRLHRLKVWEDPNQEWKDFRPLLAIGCVFFNRWDWGKVAIDHWEEAIWFFGREAFTAFQHSSRISIPQLSSVAFEDSGVYVFRDTHLFTIVDLGDVGQKGKGGHAHNDSLSFDLFAFGQLWIQDPGAYIYTHDYQARNLFRSTSYHNTMIIPQREQNIIDVHALFEMRRNSIARPLSWLKTLGSDTYLAGELQYLHDPTIKHVRTFFLDSENHAFVVTDMVTGLPPPYQSFFHFAPGLKPEVIESPFLGLRLSNSFNRVAFLFSVSGESTKAKLSESWISESYGVRVPAKTACFEWMAQNHKVIILFPGVDRSLKEYAEKILENERRFLRQPH